VTGALTAIAGFPIPAGGTGTFAAAAEQMAYGNGRLFVVNDGSDTLSIFAVNQTTGALTALPYSPVALPAGQTWGAVAVHPSGSPVIVGNSTSGFLLSFNVTPTTLTEAAGSPFSMGGANPFSIAFSRDGRYVYGGGNVGSEIAGFGVTPSTGVLTALPGSPFPSGGLSPVGYVTDTAGRLFIAALQNMSDARVFTTVDGVPTGVTGNPFPATSLNQPVRGVLHPAGYYVVAARNSSNVGVFRINGTGAATTLTAVSGSPFSSGGASTNTLAIAPRDLILAGNGGSRNLTVFRINPSTGA
jgi:6-phosphogluconolactonase